jgi:hypothetical protein
MPELLSLVIQSARAAIHRRNDLIFETSSCATSSRWLCARSAGCPCAGETAFSGSWSGSFARTGAATFYMSDRKRSFAGTGVAGDCIGGGDREPGSDGLGCRLTCVP